MKKLSKKGEVFFCRADMGSVKIVSREMNCFFSNGFGDGGFKVIVGRKAPRVKEYEDKSKSRWHYKAGHEVYFQGHFTVKEEDSVFIADYDCGKGVFDFSFSTGRWFVENYRGNIYIYKVDKALHA